ncbi:hypothetical protein SAMN04489743_1419 [Pseudarthrobacter equi]|uniref:Uncharacterized protein n=1 Tax=Pseudarthrobacter equi TaxID=728066 RepID=A0A1H1WRE9_9MICC|nr:hypothetical protein [Pseudarthrobacter equi]SDS99665.1 hypothetical protein SAMN04489743_1419 [Pseudarthrobacter equi]
MLGKPIRWFAPISAIAVILFSAPGAGAAVSRPPQLQEFQFKLDGDAGEGCPFDVNVTGTGGKITQIELKDGRVFTAGKGVLLTWSNPANGKSYTVNTSGSVAKYVTNPDGTATATFTGHNGFAYFGNDAPGAGITQYTGRLVVTLVSLKTFQVKSVDATAGQALNVCELLA